MLAVLLNLLSLGACAQSTTTSQSTATSQSTPTSSTHSGNAKRWMGGYPGFAGYGSPSQFSGYAYPSGFYGGSPGQFSGYAPGFAGSYNNRQFSGYAPGFAGSYNSVWKRNTENNDWNNIGKMCYLAAEEFENNSQLSQCAMYACSQGSIPVLNATAPTATPTFEKRFIGYNGYGDQLGALAAAEGLNQGASWNQGTEWNRAGAGDQGYGNYGGAYGGFPSFGGFGK
ncbi:hypothetical protein HDV04_003938 [Boothiomyces sp. JEL0838]|nr:hypothetical protein HDV04_003938 [Boothiomyces sp. JEL0838]